MKLTGAEIVAEVLVEQKADTIFGFPGGALLNIYDALYHYQDKIRHIITAHEQGAAHAADGYARATGKTGVVLATSGPGATNLVTGIATAYMDSVPMVAITGNVATSMIGFDSFQEVYTAGITMPITKHNFVVHHVEKLADTLRDAFRIASTGRPGPVLVDIPKDVTAAVAEFQNQPLFVPPPFPEPDEENLRAIAALINESERPVLYFGGGVDASGAGELVRALCKKAQIPACHTIMATGVLSYGEPLDLGMIGMHGNVSSGRAVQHCDLLITVGARFSDRVATDKHNFAKGAKIVQIDIDPSEINKNVNSDLSAVGDAKHVLSRLLPLVEQREHPEWVGQIQEWKKTLDPAPADSDTKLKPYRIISTIARLAGEDAIIVTDVGQHQMWAAQFCRRTKPRSFLTSGGLGTMGYGLGAAIGAKIACPDRTVVHITGDGCFHMNLNELCTAVTYNIPTVTVVLNNNVLGMVREWQTYFYGRRYSCTDLDRKTDYVKLAEAFGAKGWHAETPAEFEKALSDALAAGGPCVIECSIDRDENFYPMIPAGATIDEVIVD